MADQTCTADRKEEEKDNDMTLTATPVASVLADQESADRVFKSFEQLWKSLTNQAAEQLMIEQFGPEAIQQLVRKTEQRLEEVKSGNKRIDRPAHYHAKLVEIIRQSFKASPLNSLSNEEALTQELQAQLTPALMSDFAFYRGWNPIGKKEFDRRLQRQNKQGLTEAQKDIEAMKWLIETKGPKHNDIPIQTSYSEKEDYPEKVIKPTIKRYVETEEDKDANFWAEQRMQLREQIDELMQDWGIYVRNEGKTLEDLQAYCEYAARYSIICKWVVREQPFTPNDVIAQSSGFLEPLSRARVIPRENPVHLWD